VCSSDLECTNISVGYSKEHTTSETQNIAHLEKLVEACIHIKWDELPVKRNPEEVIRPNRYSNIHITNYNNNHHRNSRLRSKKFKGSNLKRDYVTMDDMFFHVNEILNNYGFDLVSNNEKFEECLDMYYLHKKTNDFFTLKIIDFDIFITIEDNLPEFKSYGNDLVAFEKIIALNYQHIDDENEEDEEYFEFDNEYYELQWDKLTNKDLDDFVGFYDELKDVDVSIIMSTWFELPEIIKKLFIEYESIFNNKIKKPRKNEAPKPNGKILPVSEFSDLQEEYFSKVTGNNNKFIEKLLVQYYQEGKIKLTTVLYDKIEQMFEALNIDIKGDITPADFIEWIRYYADNKDQQIEPETFKINNVFLKMIYTDDSYYTKQQYTMFSDIVVQKEDIIRKVITQMKKNDSPKIDNNTESILDLSIDELGMSNEIREGRGNFNSGEFLLFIYDYIEEILNYYQNIVVLDDAEYIE
jgi:uncharacterized protein (UPF0335 family)